MRSNGDIEVIGVDVGGTKILAGRVYGGRMTANHKTLVPGGGSENDVVRALFEAIDKVFDKDISGIGVGVPSVVDIKTGIVYDVQNIPSWKKVYLKDILEHRYGIPVYINNDANCFAAGEKYFGEGQNHENFAAVIIGTGMAAGMIIHNKLYNGSNCGAGEFGTMPYLEHNFEYYCSGQFFKNVHQMDGATVFRQAADGNPDAIALFEELGGHLGNAINAILYAIDPEVIILGGSVSKAYTFFKTSMWESIRKLAYSTVVNNLTIKLSSNPDIAVLGAAGLFFDAIGEIK
ncbi:MAG: ROK family protein [Bacteroidetes bacterium]|nr:MAG: ROK family protein [Bacteroidota bacterium]